MQTIDIGLTGSTAIGLPLRFANRHGLVTGATGTGKTVTLQRLAEEFSAAGVPVFAADVKGDLSGIATETPTVFWDVFRDHGHAIRTTVQDVGPLLMARMLNLNETQEGTLAIAFKIAEDGRSYIMDLEGLRWSLVNMLDDREELSAKFGNFTAASVNVIQRQLLALESQGGGELFGEPTLDILDFMRLDGGRGVVNLLHADSLMETPKLYATLLLWLLTELFRKLPEAGDLDKPKLVFFFDEAHLLFRDAPKHLVEAVERVVRLVRSKGIGVYFVTQSPADVPDAVLAQLGNRIQHALRAYTSRDQRMVRAVVSAFRESPGVNVAKAVTEMGVGEALISTLVADGVPSPVERIKVTLPKGKIGPLNKHERATRITMSPLFAKYPREIDASAAEDAFSARQHSIRGLTAPPPPNRAPVDWAKVYAPYGALAQAPKPLMRYVAMLFAGVAILMAATTLPGMLG